MNSGGKSGLENVRVVQQIEFFFTVSISYDMEVNEIIVLKLFFVSINDHQLTQDARDFIVCSSHHGSKEDKHMSCCELKQFLSYSSHPFEFI